jgi:hypothetical protein
MKKPAVLIASLLATLLPSAGAFAAELSATEMRWLKAGWPVVAYAREQQLPLDIVVQPQARPGDAPLAMGFVDGRCKMVLSMRGNPEAEATLDQIEPSLLKPVIEAMFAHELGHCWRYVRGAWNTVPAGFVDATDELQGSGQDAAKLRSDIREMRDTRREEGFADLVGLAWTLAHHPARYDEVHGWFTRTRDDQPVPGAHHDTRSWLRLARERSAFPNVANPFEQVLEMWNRGLQSAP